MRLRRSRKGPSVKTFQPHALEGKVAIVTGGAHGIGWGIAKALAGAGAKVTIADVNEELGSAAAKKIDCRFQHTDLCQAQSIQTLVEKTAALEKSIDIIVNNARPRLPKAAVENLQNGWDLGMDVLLKAPMLLIDFSLPFLKKSTGASIINISSTNAHVIAPQPAVYHVAKSGLSHLTKFLAHHLGSFGIRANLLSPGLVDVFDDNRPLTSDPLNRTIVETVVPLQRACLVEEVGDAAIFLASEAARYITGQEIVLDGGVTSGDQFHVAKRAYMKGQLP